MEPFKNLFNPEMIGLMGFHFKRVWKEFDRPKFIAEATNNLDALELKQRSDQIKQALDNCLPKSFKKAAPILLKSLHPESDVDLSGTSMDKKGIRGWAIAPMAHYVGERGLDDFELGMSVQKELTKRFTSEFGIRYFILADSEKALSILKNWTVDPNYHVRRLVSEGSRPRLPWGMQLTEFVKNPDPLLPLLEALKDDSEEYVRRSVANNLNDIAKDHPGKVAKIAKAWLKYASPQRQKLVRHACRTLIKQGHKATLSALGYSTPKVFLESLEVSTPIVQFGEALHFDIAIKSTGIKDQNLIIDYIIHHRKASGKTTPKVFKWKNLTLKKGQSLQAARKHTIKPITTRTYYAGTHMVEIVINGEKLGQAAFELQMS
jgi:3-methyladenine DNA glycosylase AlkC